MSPGAPALARTSKGPRGRSLEDRPGGHGAVYPAERLAGRAFPARLPPTASWMRAHARGWCCAAGAGPSCSAEAVWDPAAVAPGKPQDFRLSYSFRCIVGLRRRTAAMGQSDAPPRRRPGPGGWLAPSPRIQSDAEPVRQKGPRTGRRGHPGPQRLSCPPPVRLRPRPARGAGPGADGGRGRVLHAGRKATAAARAACWWRSAAIAACRPGPWQASSSGPGREQNLHWWAEAWVGHWMPLDPAYGRFRPDR